MVKSESEDSDSDVSDLGKRKKGKRLGDKLFADDAQY